MTSIDTLLTDHLDIWTSAIARKSSAGRGRSRKFSLHGIEKLRTLILDLAVIGKLVPQDPNDEPASELLKRIAKNKTLLNSSFTRKSSKYGKAPSDWKYRLPDSWSWVSMSEIGHDWGQTTPSTDFTYIDVGSIDQQFGRISEAAVLNAADAPSRARKRVDIGTVIYSTVRPYLLNIAIVDRAFDPQPIASTAFAIVHPYEGISASFVYRYLRSPTFISYVESCQTGIAYPAINDKQFFSAWFPLPPEAEQLRIVAKVDELMALCDRLGAGTYEAIEAHQLLVTELLATLTASRDASELAENWARIETHFDTLFVTEDSVDQLKQTILQLAVMGRLVPQDPKDEPASELLKRVKIEKAELVTQGKIKKSKPLPPIMNTEKPFDLPTGWEWSRLADISNVGTGATPSRTRPDYYEPAEINWVTSGETSQKYINDTKEKISLKALQETNVLVYPPGTLLIALYGQGKTRGQVTELNVEAGTNQACAAIRLIEASLLHRKFVRLFLEMAYDAIRLHSAGGAQPNLNVGKIAGLVIPIPPLSEQERIVAKVDDLVALCDTLNAQLAKANDGQNQLAETIVAKAVA